MNLHPTHPALLVAAGGFFCATTWMLVYRFYGVMAPVPMAVPILLLGLAGLCVVFGKHVKESVADNSVGLDRSQLNPLRAAAYAALGRTCAWMGALMAGCYLGVSVYVVPRAGEMSAAAADTPIVVAATLAAVALAWAGKYLERNCMTPPNAVG